MIQPSAHDADTELTSRQSEVLDLYRAGHSPTEIARVMGISSQGVHGHLRRLEAKGLVAPTFAAVARRRRPERASSEDDPIAVVRETAAHQVNLVEERIAELDDEIERLEQEKAELQGTLQQLRRFAGDPEATIPLWRPV